MTSNILPIEDKENLAPTTPAERANLVELIRKLYVDELKQCDEQGRKLFSEVQKKQEEISFLQKVIQGINSGINDRSELDLTNNPHLVSLLREAQIRFGLDVPGNKQKFSASEWQRLVDNNKSFIEDGNAQVQLKLNDVNRINNKLSEIIKIFDSILKGLHRTVEEIIRGMR